MSHVSKPILGKHTARVLSQRVPEQVPLFTTTESASDDASGGVIVNAAPAPKTEAHIDNAPLSAGENGSLSVNGQTESSSMSDVIPTFLISIGEKAKAHDIIDAIKTLQTIETEQRPPTQEERDALSKFPGFGAVALRLFPDPVTGQYKDDSWKALGEELHGLLTPEEYDSAKRTTFTAFYTSPIVMQAMHDALARLGLPHNATVLEPGCGAGGFMGHAPEGMRFIGVELDSLSGRIARALYPEHDIRIENFRDTRLPPIDAVIGNVPFADVKVDYNGKRLSLHDFFLAKSVDALKPGGVMAVVTTHYTLDKQNPAMRERLANRADFLGAIRLPSDAFKREGTSVVTDILFLRKRGPGEEPNHADPAWLETEPLTIEGADIPINRYFLNHPEMVLGTWSRQDRLYGGTYSLESNGELAEQLQEAIERLPANVFSCSPSINQPSSSRIESLPPLERHVTEGSFFVADDKTIRQVQHGHGVPVTHCNRTLTADGTMMGRRLTALIEIRDQARRVLLSQNEDWPARQRDEARRELNRAYDAFMSRYGAINKTTISAREDGTVTRRMPNLVKFRDDPDAMLVMSLEQYDEEAEGQESRHHGAGCGGPRPTCDRGEERGRGAATVPQPTRTRRPALYLRLVSRPRRTDHRRARRPHLSGPRNPGMANRRSIPVGECPGQAESSRRGRISTKC
jgi:hypothetical protein